MRARSTTLSNLFTDWNQLRRESAEQRYKRHLDRVTFRVTLASTIITLLAAAAALWAAYEAHKARIDDERPFVAVDVTPTSWQYTGATDPMITTVVAFGKSPAREVTVDCTIVLSPASSTYPLWKPTTKIEHIQFNYLLPSRSARIFCNDPAVQGTKTDYDRAIELGILKYKDDHGADYTTPFCDDIAIVKTGVAVGPCGTSEGLPPLK
jgi:hypothetical protein